jgi:hypothetical protein
MPLYNGDSTLRNPKVRWQDGSKNFNSMNSQCFTVAVDYTVMLTLYPEDLAKKQVVNIVREERY